VNPVTPLENPANWWSLFYYYVTKNRDIIIQELESSISEYWEPTKHEHYVLKNNIITTKHKQHQEEPIVPNLRNNTPEWFFWLLVGSKHPQIKAQLREDALFLAMMLIEEQCLGLHSQSVVNFFEPKYGDQYFRKFNQAGDSLCHLGLAGKSDLHPDTPPSGKGAPKILRLFCSDDRSWRKASLDQYNARIAFLPKIETKDLDEKLRFKAPSPLTKWTVEDRIRRAKEMLANPRTSKTNIQHAEKFLNEIGEVKSNE